ncbi:hypothetical protein NQ318_020524 [Aromia moschata]|uniref:BTB domain-containing protein n=1 Tax=Aromia moschata TaxID=1265417 RepID=A0AAV8Z349_9CUCU|nr:hypothetical protein NQ318_020524 [Aromia moschata]
MPACEGSKPDGLRRFRVRKETYYLRNPKSYLPDRLGPLLKFTISLGSLFTIRRLASRYDVRRLSSDATCPSIVVVCRPVVHPIRKKFKMGSRVGGLSTAGLPADKALAGVPRLLDDLQRLSEDTDSADIVFILGREEERVFAHRVILMARLVQSLPGIRPLSSIKRTPSIVFNKNRATSNDMVISLDMSELFLGSD